MVTGFTFFCKCFEIGNEILFTASLDKLLHDEDRPGVHAALRAHLKDRSPFQVECRLRDRAGKWRWFFVAGMALWDESGRAFRMAGSVVEVTERKEAERVLQDTNRAKDEFLATLAHELRNPLAPIRTGLEILKKDEGNGVLSQRARATMERQLTHIYPADRRPAGHLANQ